MVIFHDQCEVVFRDCGHDHMMWMIVWCGHCGQSFCFVGMEGRSDSVFCFPLVWLVERLSLPDSVFVRHGVFHGD
jgi:hypothetical protein